MRAAVIEKAQANAAAAAPATKADGEVEDEMAGAEENGESEEAADDPEDLT